MDILEKVEKIREKTGVSYEEAKAALEAVNGDILDAIVLLETQGKIKSPATASYTTGGEDNTSKEFKEAAEAYSGSDELGGAISSFLKWCGKMIKAGCENFFIVKRHNEVLINIPVIVLILLVIFAFWLTLPVLIAGLFFGFRYCFQGEIAKSVDVNKACDKAAEACEAVKKEFTSEKKGEKGDQ